MGINPWQGIRPRGAYHNSGGRALRGFGASQRKAPFVAVNLGRGKMQRSNIHWRS
jgi:hypothetical protein